MKNLIIIFISFFSLNIFAQDITSKNFGLETDINKKSLRIEFKTNKFYSHFLFAQSLANASHMGVSPSLKVAFDRSDFAEKSNIQDAINKIQQINTFYKYDFEGYPTHRFNSIQLYQLLKIAAANSKDIDDFSSRIIGMIPMNDLLDLIESLKIIEPVHEQLVWQPNEKKLNDYLQKVESKALKGNFQKDFQKAAKFYGSTWNPIIPFQVYILPIPELNGSYYEMATPEGNILTYTIRLKDKPRLAGDLGVIFHELCHILYKNQASETQHVQEKLFLDHSSLYRIIGYQVLDEVLATSLGQGWYYKQLTNELDNNSWYSAEQVNKVSKASYELVEEYVEAGKTLDEVFVNRYLALYESSFKDDLFNINSNISDINLWTSESLANPNILFPYFFENFNMRSINEFDALDEQNFQDWQNTLGTKMIIIDTNSESYEFISQRIDWLPKMNKSKDVLFTNIINGEQYYVLIVSDFEAVEKAFKLLNQKAKISETIKKMDF